ncbi:MAG: TRAP transporter small permease subunit [Alphaproteobacteria bacterium]|nr:TRAP transporter small permease subunit [Alphaproteobacteria bacterium]
MPRAIRLYVKYVDAVNRIVGRFALYLIFAMIAVLFWSAISRLPWFQPSLWTLEMAQFLMAAYYLLGGAYSMQEDYHVRMDLLYGMWSRKRKGFADSITAFCLVFYLILLIYGGISSAEYAIVYGETSYSSWSPYMWPIKVVMTFGIVLMLLQAVAIFFRDLAAARGMTLEGEKLPEETPA